MIRFNGAVFVLLFMSCIINQEYVLEVRLLVAGLLGNKMFSLSFYQAIAFRLANLTNAFFSQWAE